MSVFFQLLRTYKRELGYGLAAVLIGLIIVFAIRSHFQLIAERAELRQQVATLTKERSYVERSHNASNETVASYVQSIGERSRQQQQIRDEILQASENETIDHIWRLYCLDGSSPICDSLETLRED